MKKLKRDEKDELKEIRKRMRRCIRDAQNDYDDALEDHGDSTTEYLWEKCKLETLIGVMTFVDPTYQSDY